MKAYVTWGLNGITVLVKPVGVRSANLNTKELKHLDWRVG